MKVRLRHLWLVITGRIHFDYSPERMEFFMALDKTLAALVALNDAAQRLIAKAAADEAALGPLQDALAQAQADLATVDDQTAAAIQPVLDSLNAAAPAPVEAPAVDGSVDTPVDEQPAPDAAA